MDSHSPQRSQWWQRGVVYQVYPRSFMDSDGDGVGDLRGVLARLDHLAWLGVDAVWLSPIYPSPMVDFGYDVSDYTGIHPPFGTLDDFDALCAALHARGMKLILDFVPNHTSDQHPWFVESRASRTSAKRDWYLWRDAPNNWLSVFGGSAWEKDAATGQLYYHAYFKEQPDLNWRNPAVEAAMHGVMRFWLDRGVDGFRVDVIAHLIKDELFRDNAIDPAWSEGQPEYRKFRSDRNFDLAGVHEVIARMRGVLDSYPDDRMMVGEAYIPIDRLMAYYGTPAQPECHMPFNFELLSLPWDARRIATAIAAYEAALPAHGWPNWVMGNHDMRRVASRTGSAQAGVAAVLLLTLRGTPTIYQGDEVGMEDVPIPPDRVRDPLEKTRPGKGRDPVRTPMPWEAGARAGFTTGEPWLPLGADTATRNVAAQRADPDSLLTLYRRGIALRRAEPALATGAWKALPASGDLLAYERMDADRRFAVVLNLGAGATTYRLPSPGRVVLATDRRREGTSVAVEAAVAGNEALVVHLT